MRFFLLLVACSGGSLTLGGPPTVCPGTTETIAVHAWNTDTGSVSLNGVSERTLSQESSGDLLGVVTLETYLPDINKTQVDTITTDAVWTLATRARLTSWFGVGFQGGDTLSRHVFMPSSQTLAFHNFGCGYSTGSVDPNYLPVSVSAATWSPSILVKGVTVAPHNWPPGSPGYGSLTSAQVTYTAADGTMTTATLMEGVVSHAFDNLSWAGTWSIQTTYTGLLLDNCRHPPIDPNSCAGASYMCTVPGFPDVPDTEVLSIDLSC